MSEKRTVLGAGFLGPGFWGRAALSPEVRVADADFVEVAWAKSGERVGSLGEVRVVDVEGEEKPWNWEVRSLYCFCNDGKESEMVAAFLNPGLSCQRCALGKSAG